MSYQMTVKDLIEKLTEACEEAGVDPSDVNVRLAIQPNYPFQHHVDQVVAVDLNAPTEREEEDFRENASAEERAAADEENGPKEWVVFIGEGGQLHDAPYLPGIASEALGWGGR